MVTNKMFSVVVPLYNKKDNIGKTLESALAQTFTDFEVIVVDDGSTDGSGDLVRAIASEDPRIRLITQENRYIGAARNRGVKHAGGEYIAFLDADDLWKTNHLEELYALAKSYPEAGLLGTSFLWRREGYGDFAGIVEEFEGKRGIVDYFKYVTDFQFIYTSSIAVRSDVFKEIGMFNEDRVYKSTYEDRELWTRVAARYLVAYSGVCTVIYMTDVPGQATGSNSINRFICPALGQTLHKLLTSKLGKHVDIRQFQLFSEQMIFNEFRNLMTHPSCSADILSAYIGETGVVEWAKGRRLKLMIRLPIPLLWKPYFLYRRCMDSRMTGCALKGSYRRRGLVYNRFPFSTE